MEKQIRLEKRSSEIRSAIEELSLMVKTVNPQKHAIRVAITGECRDHHDHDYADHRNDHHDHDHDHDHLPRSVNIPTKPFLFLCNLVLQVLDKIGPTMAVLRQDVQQNIQRLEKLYECDPLLYSNVVEVMKKEVAEGTAKKGPSCSKSLVWLTRSLDFTLALLQKLMKEEGVSMEKAVEEAYDVTLKPWHRWISSAAFRVGLRLVPDKQHFICLLLAEEETYESLKENMQALVLLSLPLLEDIHCALRCHGMDKIRST